MLGRTWCHRNRDYSFRKLAFMTRERKRQVSITPVFALHQVSQLSLPGGAPHPKHSSIPSIPSIPRTAQVKV